MQFDIVTSGGRGDGRQQALKLSPDVTRLLQEVGGVPGEGDGQLRQVEKQRYRDETYAAIAAGPSTSQQIASRLEQDGTTQGAQQAAQTRPPPPTSTPHDAMRGFASGASGTADAKPPAAAGKPQAALPTLTGPAGTATETNARANGDAAPPARAASAGTAATPQSNGPAFTAEVAAAVRQRGMTGPQAGVQNAQQGARAVSAVGRGGGDAAAMRGAPNPGGGSEATNAASPRGAGGGARASSGSKADVAAQAAAEADGDEQVERKSDANMARMVRLIHTRLGEKHSTATMHLDPPELGKLRLRMDLHHQNLSLRVDAETSAAQRLLTEQVDSLRRSLEATGLRLGQVDIRTTEPTQAADDAGLSQQSDVPARGDEHAGGNAGSAGRGSDDGTEAPRIEQDEPADMAEAQMELAAESRVDVLA